MDITDWLRGLSKRRKTAFGEAGLDGCRYDEAAAEISSLRAELAANNELYAISQSDLAAVSLQYDAATAVIERLEAAARQDAEEALRWRRIAADATEDLGRRIDLGRQDAEEKAQLKEALQPFSDIADLVQHTPQRDGERVFVLPNPAGGYFTLVRDDFRRARAIEVAKFKPCVVFNEELRLTEMLLEDALIIWKPWGPYKGHAVDLGYSEDERLIGIKIWDDVRSRPQGEKS